MLIYQIVRVNERPHSVEARGRRTAGEAAARDLVLVSSDWRSNCKLGSLIVDRRKLSEASGSSRQAETQVLVLAGK